MIGKTIKSLLAGSSTLTNLVPATKIFPYVMNEDTDLPAVVFMINSIDTEYSQIGWAGDVVTFSVWSFSKSFSNLQSIASAVRGALELKKTGSGNESIGRILLTGMEEGYDLEADAFYNKLNFQVKVNSY